MSQATQATSGTNKVAVFAVVAAVIAVVPLMVWTTIAAVENLQHGLPDAVAWLLIVPGPVAALAGISLGHVARSQIKRSGQSGRGLALVAVIVSYLAAVGYIALVVLFALVIEVLKHGPS